MDRHRLDITLIVLIGLAIATLVASRRLMGGPVGGAVVLGLAILKGRRILLDFMALRTAPDLWRGLVTAWVVGVASFAWLASVVRLLI